MGIKPQSESGVVEPPNQSEEFISNFIRCQKQRIASKLNQPVETSEDLLRYIQSKTRPGRSEDSSYGNVATTAYTANNTSEMRMSRTEKHQILPVESPEKGQQKANEKEKNFRKTLEGHTRQISQPNSSPRKPDTSSERANYNTGNVQLRLRKTAIPKMAAKVEQKST